MLKEIGIFGIIVLFLLVMTIGGLFLKVIGIGWFGANKLVDTNYKVIDKTLDADNVIYNYEWFKQQKEDIDAQYGKIASAQQSIKTFEAIAGPRISWTFEDKDTWTKLTMIELGLENKQKDMIAIYNARAKMATRSIFQNGLIPQALEFEANLIK